MRPSSRVFWCAVGLALGSAAVYAQTVISAHSGTVQSIEGQVLVDGKALESSATSFPDVKEKSVLRTEDGRAEVLLTPGVFLRVAENSSFRMITNRLVDTRLEFLSGSAILEVDDLLKDNNVSVVFKDVTVQAQKRALYRFDYQPARVRVFHGETLVKAGDREIAVKEGQELTLDGLAVTKFDKNDLDALDRWSRRRGEYVAMANVSAAKQVHDMGGFGGYYGGYYGGYPGGLGYPGLGMYGSTGAWMYNPYFGMFTYVPLNGMMYSPYGYQFWSPVTVGQVYYAPRPTFNRGGYSTYNSSLGYNTMGRTSSGYSGVVTSSVSGVRASGATSGAAASAPSAPVSRGGASSGPRR